jgi:hypothetical protein
MISCSAIVMISAAALAGAVSRQKTALQVSRTGGFDLPCSAAVAFSLFSPEGERDWAKGWSPRPVFPDSIAFSRDTVFREGEGDDEAVWTILDVDWKTHRVEYVRLAPASHTAHIVVHIETVAPEHSRVTVSYTVTAFGEHAANLIEAFSEAAYSAKMRDWQRQISACLENPRSRSGSLPPAPPSEAR